MRELVFSVGITFLTGTLIFVYFRNKMNNIDKKVNMVFETIQEHNVKMQRQAQMEMQRFAAYQESRMTSQESREVGHVEQNAENAENNQQKQGAWNSEANSDTNLIDVSEDDSDSDGFDSSEEEDDDNMNDDNMNDDTDKITKVDDDDKLKISDGKDGLEGLEVLDGKLAEIHLEKKIIQPNVDYTKLTKAQLIICCEDAGISFKKSSNKSVLIQLLEISNQPVVNLEQ
jgi:hypothetical protein